MQDHWQLRVAAHEIRDRSNRLTNHLDVLVALEQFLPENVQLQLGDSIILAAKAPSLVLSMAQLSIEFSWVQMIRIGHLSQVQNTGIRYTYMRLKVQSPNGIGNRSSRGR